jgi:hypothetical protein
MANNISPAGSKFKFTAVEIITGVAMAFSLTDLIIDLFVGSDSGSPWVIMGDVFRIAGLTLFSVVGVRYFWKRFNTFQRVMMAGAISTYLPHALFELLIHAAGMGNLISATAVLGMVGLVFLIPLLVTMFSGGRRVRSRR